MTSNRITLAAALFSAVAAMSATNASATLITGVTATTNMGSDFGTDIANAVNGVGLSAISLNATHDEVTPANSWVSQQVTTGQVTFNLNGSYTLAGFSFWNQNAGGPDISGATGLRDVQVSTSINGSTFSNWFNHSFTKVETGDMSLVEMVSGTAVNANYVRFNILSNWGDVNQSAFAEVQFDSGTAPIPEPETYAMMLAGLGVLGLVARRRKSL